MHTKETKDRDTNFRCNPGNFKAMLKMMNTCCSTQDIPSDWQDKMKGMMETCCGPKAKNTKA